MRKRITGPTRDREEGASAVEFAIVAPLLFMLVFAIIQFGIFFAQDIALSNGARQAARAAAVPSNDCAEVERQARLGSNTIAMDPDDVAVAVTRGPTPGSATAVCASPGARACDGADDGDAVYVTTIFRGSLIIPLAIYDDDIELEREGHYRCEYSS